MRLFTKEEWAKRDRCVSYGCFLASGYDNIGIVLWDVSLESWLAKACAMANRNLTREEWQSFFAEEPYQATPVQSSRTSQNWEDLIPYLWITKAASLPKAAVAAVGER